MKNNYLSIIRFIKELYSTDKFIPLHEPKFIGNEKSYVIDCIDSTYVSSVGGYVDRFEEMVANYVGVSFAVATVNGTSALHIALKLSGVMPGDEVITQPLSFIATCNAISYCGATPVFVDVDIDTLGLGSEHLRKFLIENTVKKSQGIFNKVTGKRIAAVLPMHTFGNPCRIDAIAEICSEFGLPLVEDAAESLGSFYRGKHTGSFGSISAFSFNGNKTITTGGGGMIVTDDEFLARRAKHMTTTSKLPHAYDFEHDEIGYNYRMPNINAALGCAQMEGLSNILLSKREVASAYLDFFKENGFTFVQEIDGAKSNYWLNAIMLKDRNERDHFIKDLNDSDIMVRPIWRLMPELLMYSSCQSADISNAKWLEERVVNLPSSARL